MIYESVCQRCYKVHIYRSKVDDRHKTPTCCGVATMRKTITPPMGFVIGKAAG